MKDDENRMKFLCDPEQHKLTLALHRQENLRANRAEVELAIVTAERDALLAAQMTEEKAREILDSYWFSHTSSVFTGRNNKALILSGEYSAKELEAMAWAIRNKGMENKGVGK